MIIQNTAQASQLVPAGARASASELPRGESKLVAPNPIQNSAPQASAEELKNAVASMNQAMRQSNRDLQFSVDTETKKTVVKMVDTSTGELIRQYPTEEALAISRSIDQFQQGLLLTQKA